MISESMYDSIEVTVILADRVTRSLTIVKSMHKYTNLCSQGVLEISN